MPVVVEPKPLLLFLDVLLRELHGGHAGGVLATEAFGEGSEEAGVEELADQTRPQGFTALESRRPLVGRPRFGFRLLQPLVADGNDRRDHGLITRVINQVVVTEVNVRHGIQKRSQLHSFAKCRPLSRTVLD